MIGIEAGGAKSSPADMLAALPAEVLEKLPAGIREGIASGKIDLAKVDPKLIAQFAAMAGIDAGVIAAFLDSVRTRLEPQVTARQGREALALALEIQATMAAHAKRAGLEDFFHPGA